MLPALIIVFREGFEAFVTVAIIFAFLRKTGRDWLRPTVYAGIATSIAASFALGCLLGILGAALMSWAWAHYGVLITLRRCFQLRAMFLLLFTTQIGFWAIPGLSGAEGRPQREAIRTAPEPFSPVGIYGK